jgi:hypothetical protein
MMSASDDATSRFFESFCDTAKEESVNYGRRTRDSQTKFCRIQRPKRANGDLAG